MKITALEIKQHEFEKTFRGYDIEEVDMFLSNMAQEWEKLTNESKMLKMQLDIAEKESSKLREVEMTLIKTLRTAEDTSSRITNQAQLEADTVLDAAKLESETLLNESKYQAEEILKDANQKANEIISTAKLEFSEMESKFSNLENYRSNLLSQLRNIANTTLEMVDGQNHNNDLDVAYKPLAEPTFEEEDAIATNNLEDELLENLELSTSEEESEDEDEEPESEIVETSFSSSANSIHSQSKNDDLSIIEGIGPKIKEVLNSEGINSFKDLINTPASQIKELLVSAGPHFAMHDPSSWAQQAELAENGNWEELEKLKDILIAGRVVKEEPKIEPVKTVDKYADQATEEMLEKVNKVKAAIRKSMLEKGDSIKTEEPKIETEKFENKPQSGGSFFDNFN